MTDSRQTELAQSLAAARERVAVAAANAGRSASDIALLVVTKFFPAEDLQTLVDLGAAEFGESREPEASRKVAFVRAARPDASFAVDMIGSVQRKKARTVSRWARRVHSVDSLELVEALGGAAGRSLDEGERTDPLGVLLQLSLDGDPARGGVTEDALAPLADAVAGHPDSLRLDGLMVIAPLAMAAEGAMAQAASTYQRFQTAYPDAKVFSAGMSDDLDIAIAHGSTCVRVGTAIMGARPILSP